MIVAVVTLDADGQSAPSDWALPLAREAQKQLQSGRPRTLARPLEVGK